MGCVTQMTVNIDEASEEPCFRTYANVVVG